MAENGGDGGGWWPEDEGRSKSREDKPERPPRGLASPKSTRSPSRYSMFVGLAFVALIIIALLNLVGGTDQTGITLEEGRPLPEFAAPSAAGGSEADANVAQDDCESSRNPCPSDQRRTAACEIATDGEASDAIRVCDLFDKPLAISFWFTRGGDCIPSQDAFDQVARRYEDRVNFLSMNVRDDRETVARIAAEGDWVVPVGLDPDGAVSNLYRVGVCPTVVLAYPGGIVFRDEFRPPNIDSKEIGGWVRDLIEASRVRAGVSR